MINQSMPIATADTMSSAVRMIKCNSRRILPKQIEESMLSGNGSECRGLHVPAHANYIVEEMLFQACDTCCERDAVPCTHDIDDKEAGQRKGVGGGGGGSSRMACEDNIGMLT